MTADHQEQLFRRWLADHAGLLWKVVRAFAALATDQEDLLQEISLQLWNSVPAFRGDARESTWIYRVAFNTAIGWQRSEKRRRLKHEAFLKFHDEPAHEPSGDSDLIAALYAAIRELPKLDASLALMLLDDLSYREMADVLGISENYVGVKLNRVRKQLADSLKGAHHEL
ncbi:MAG: polymerase sigma factor, sigma-70 family [Verrucomicrobiaceae bacterium]|nr:polymerase sigma factor, sigma-70 family [Verrucomicrobiaceae bacterium]